MRPPSQHVSVDSLARYAFARDPESPDFDGVRDHLAGGCGLCSLQLAAFRRADAELPRTTAGADDWIVPRRVGRDAERRSGVLADYQLVCGVGNYELDVLVREVETPRRLDIGGQVTQALALHDPARNVPLFLLEARGNDVVSTTRTDEFGEFDFSAMHASRYGLRVGDQSDSPCVLVWDGAA